MYLLENIFDDGYKFSLYGFNQLTLPNYLVKTIGEEQLNKNKKAKISHCKAMGKYIRATVLNHYHRVVKKERIE